MTEDKTKGKEQHLRTETVKSGGYTERMAKGVEKTSYGEDLKKKISQIYIVIFPKSYKVEGEKESVHI